MVFTSPTAATSARATAEVSSFLRILTTAPRIDLDPSGPTVSVVVPTRNEARNLGWLARHMPANIHELILVDGASTDGTVETARALWPDVRVIQQTRKGKGNALACGFEAARGEVIVMIDADGSMDPGEIPYFVQALSTGADYAKGSRFAVGGGSSDITPLRAWGNRGLNGVTALLHGTVYSDLCYGFNAFWRRILPVLGLDAGVAGEDPDARRWGDGFEVETLINIRVHVAGLAIAEVPSFESERLHGQSNLNTFRDGLRVLRTIALEKLAKGRRPALALSSREDLAAIPGPALLQVGSGGQEFSAATMTAAEHEAIDPLDALDGRDVRPGHRHAELDPADLDIVSLELADADREFEQLRAAS